MVAVFHPRPYQGRLIARIERFAHAALFVDMGMGKTACMLTAIAAHGWRTLVVAPKLVVENTWPDEIRAWKHTRCLLYSLIPSSLHFDPSADVHGVSYDTLASLCQSLPRELWPWSTIIFDESSKIKAPTTQRMLLLKRVVSRFERSYILSGTPATEGYEGLWSQIYVLDQGERLGRYVSHYRANYFQRPPSGYGYRILPGAAERIRGTIADLVVSLRSEDYIKLPPLVVSDVPVRLPANALAQYKAMEKQLVMDIGRHRITAANAGAKSMKCRQAASGHVYDADSTPRRLHDAKLEALRTIIDEAQGEPVLVAYQFRFELAELQRAFHRAVSIREPGAIARWSRREIPILLAHPRSAGHGLNLQTGGRIIVWYSLTYSADEYQQLHKRLHRPGQKRPVLSYRLMAAKTIDSAIACAVEKKGDVQEGLLAALREYRG